MRRFRVRFRREANRIEPRPKEAGHDHTGQKLFSELGYGPLPSVAAQSGCFLDFTTGKTAEGPRHAARG